MENILTYHLTFSTLSASLSPFYTALIHKSDINPILTSTRAQWGQETTRKIRMITMNDIKTNLLGAFEIALFMPRGTERFSTCKAAMKKSFLVPVLCLPLTIIMVLIAHPSGNLNTSSMNALAIIYSLRLALYLGGFVAFTYLMARTMNKMDSFYSFIAANNWLSAPIAILTLIPTLMAITGLYAFTDIYALIVMLTLYTCAATAFMAAYILRVPYEMAIFMAITGMVIHHNALGFVKWAALSTLDLLA